MSSKNPADKAGKAASGGDTLRHRLLRFILIPLLVSLVIAGSVSFFAARRETAEIYDRQLVLLAQVLNSLAAQEDTDEVTHKISRYDAILSGSDENTFAYRIWVDGKLALTSPNARNFRTIVETAGFSNHRFNAEVWRVFVVKNAPNNTVVEVAARESLRTDIIQEILLVMFVPLLLAIPVITALVWFGIIRGLEPISALSGLIIKRDPYNLSPIKTHEKPLGDVPDEIIPLVDALNSLMMRMSNVLESEKKFTDHAAHELRTPLAAIKVQAQVALRLEDSGEKQKMLEDLVVGVDRASHLVSQLLSLARAQSQEGKLTPIDLGAVVKSVVGEFGSQLHARQQAVEIDVEPNVRIAANEELLMVLLRNLIDNAVKYSPHASTLHIALGCRGDQALFNIANPGPGIPEKERENIFGHFYRLPGNMETGCGLGLALAKKICEIHHAEITLASGEEDAQTCFTVTFQRLTGI